MAPRSPLASSVACLLLLTAACPEKDSSRLRRAAVYRERDAGGVAPMPAFSSLLAWGQNVPRDLHLDATHLYWLNEGRRAEGEPGIFKMPKEGGTPERLFGGRGVQAIAIDDCCVYWILPEALSVYRVPKSGGEPTVLARQEEGLSAIAVDDTHVYWAGAQAISRVPKGGGKAQAIALGISVPIGLQVDRSYAWWYSVTAGKIARVAKRGGRPATFASEDVTLHAFLADAGNVYWSYGSEKKAVLKRMAKSGGKAVVLAENQDVPVEFFVSDRDIFWTTGDAVVRLSKEGGSAVKVVEGTDRSISVAADAQRVYWTDRIGRIQSAPR